MVTKSEFWGNRALYWGRKCVPPNFWTVVISNARMSDLPVDYRDGSYGWHCSRKRLDLTKLTNGKDGLLKTQSAVGMSLVEFRMACLDNGEYWRSEVV